MDKISTESELRQPLIVGLGGTSRPGSSSECALRVALSAAAALGARTEIISGSQAVMPMFDPTRSERTPEALRLIRLLRQCDGVIVASPGYHGSMSGLIKNALDYTEDMREDARPYLEGRAVGTIVCASGWQATGTTLVALRSVVHALRGWPTPLGVAINSMTKAFDGDGRCMDTAVARQLELLAEQVVSFAKWRAASERSQWCANESLPLSKASAA